MPRVSGYDLLSYIRDDAALRTIPRVIITGSDQDDGRAVADAVFRKPIDHEKLISTIRRLQHPAPPAAN